MLKLLVKNGNLSFSRGRGVYVDRNHLKTLGCIEILADLMIILMLGLDLMRVGVS